MKKIILYILIIPWILYGVGENAQIPLRSTQHRVSEYFRYFRALEESARIFEAFIDGYAQPRMEVTDLIYTILDKPERFRTRFNTLVGPTRLLPLVRLENYRTECKYSQYSHTLMQLLERYPEYIRAVRQLAEIVKRNGYEGFLKIYKLFMFPEKFSLKLSALKPSEINYKRVILSDGTLRLYFKHVFLLLEADVRELCDIISMESTNCKNIEMWFDDSSCIGVLALNELLLELQSFDRLNVLGISNAMISKKTVPILRDLLQNTQMSELHFFNAKTEFSGLWDKIAGMGIKNSSLRALGLLGCDLKSGEVFSVITHLPTNTLTYLCLDGIEIDAKCLKKLSILDTYSRLEEIEICNCKGKTSEDLDAVMSLQQKIQQSEKSWTLKYIDPKTHMIYKIQDLRSIIEQQGELIPYIKDQFTQ